MIMYREAERVRFMMNKRVLVFLFSCFCLHGIFINSRTGYSEPRFQLAVMSDFHLQGRRMLSRPGSFPPRCTSKCGRCKPCQPVHMPVPPGTPVTAEYYPEAWRCKCGNKLYMP